VKVVLTDLLMPEMDGFELLKTIKRIYPRIQVIILSADIQISSRKLCEELGAAGFLNKPVSAENLATILKQVLTESSCS
jgi:CheY-like chemotaxis protein